MSQTIGRRGDVREPMTLTPEQERDFETVREDLGYERDSIAEAPQALSRIRSDLETKTAERDAARKERDRAQRKTFSLRSDLEAARAELRETKELLTLKENGAAIMAQVYREALERALPFIWKGEERRIARQALSTEDGFHNMRKSPISEKPLPGFVRPMDDAGETYTVDPLGVSQTEDGS